jgi:hypothetical protein
MWLLLWPVRVSSPPPLLFFGRRAAITYRIAITGGTRTRTTRGT